MDIFIKDFKKDVQEKILDVLGISNAKEGNYDVFPLFTLETAEDSDLIT